MKNKTHKLHNGGRNRKSESCSHSSFPVIFFIYIWKGKSPYMMAFSDYPIEIVNLSIADWWSARRYEY